MLVVLLVVIVLFAVMPLLMFVLLRREQFRGNTKEYSVAQMPAMKNSPLSEKTIIFLGSSSTYGSDARGESFVDFLQKRDNIHTVKAALPGATLSDGNKRSYIALMKTIDPNIRADAFVCQLSTNDASKMLPLGEISQSLEMEEFDTETITGAIEYIISYAKETWGCPVIFYTGPRYVSRPYEAMVRRLLELQEKWDIGVLDMWNDVEMNLVSPGEHSLYMANSIHPTRAGYRDWWMPKFEKYLTSYLAG